MHICTYMQAHALGLDNDKCGVTVRLTVKCTFRAYMYKWFVGTYI